MEIPTVEKKLRESAFFLHHLCQQEQVVLASIDVFDFYLSAFLSAAHTVDYRLRHEQGALYRPWRVAWKTTLKTVEASLIAFLAKDRNAEIHDSGSNRDEVLSMVPVLSGFTDAGGTVIATGQGARLPKLNYFFTIDGKQQRATQACADYLRLLERMVEKFKADNP